MGSPRDFGSTWPRTPSPQKQFAISPVHSAEQLRVAYPALAPGSSPLWVPLEKGIWKKHGLDVDLILLTGGGRAVPALLSNSIQVLVGSDTGVIQAIVDH